MTRLKRTAVTLIALGVLSAACAARQPAAQPTARPAPAALTVFAAASLKEAFTSIGKQFQADQAGAAAGVVFNFAGSQQLAQQLSQGADADVFASADDAQMGQAIATGRVVSGTQRVFARNRLVVVVSTSPSRPIQSLADLAQPGLKIVVAARAVPAGRYTLAFLDRASQGSLGSGYADAVVRNVVSYEENVRAVLAKVALGEGDAGVVYTTDLTGATASQVRRIEIPDDLNVIAIYYVAAVADSRQPAAAQQFVDAILSAAGQKVLAGYGFVTGAQDTP